MKTRKMLLGNRWKMIFAMAVFAVGTLAVASHAQQPSTDVLNQDEWDRVDESVERALQWLASKQIQRNGSFPTMMQGQPGVTSLCVMAFLSHGHVPGEGPYGAQLLKAVEYITKFQKANGLLTVVGPRGATISRSVAFWTSNTVPYNHGMSSLLLSEVYAMGQVRQIENIDETIENAVAATLTMQKWPKRFPAEQGGWRYLNPQQDYDSDLSVSGWQLMFLRSAKNAGFDVPQKPIDDAVGFVKNCFRPKFGAFLLHASDEDFRSRGMAGAGILALAHAGFHDAPEALQAGDWILRNDFRRYNTVIPFGQPEWPDDRYHYGAFNCTQAMYQLGGKYWEEFYPPMVRVLLDNQSPDGSWQAENHQYDRKFGKAYTTALSVMTLGAPNQLLPIFQR
jgi:hypothetical protein